MFLVALPLGLNSHTARVQISNFPWLLTLTDRLWPGFPIMMQPVKAAWTLSCEALFYLATPFLFVILARRKNPFSASIVMLGGTAMTVYALAFAFPMLTWTAYLRLPDFLLGIVGYQLSQRYNLARIGNVLLVSGLLLLGVGMAASQAVFSPEYLLRHTPPAPAC